MMSALKVTVDPTVDAAYAQFSDNPIVRTCQVTEEILVDVDASGSVVGVELLTLRLAL